VCATFRLHFFPVEVEEQITWSKSSQREKPSAATQMFDVVGFRGIRTPEKKIADKPTVCRDDKNLVSQNTDS